MDWKLSIEDVRRMAELENEIGFKFASYQNDSYIFTKVDCGLTYVLQIYNNGEEVLLYNKNQDFVIESSVLRNIGRIWGFNTNLPEDKVNDSWSLDLDTNDKVEKKQEKEKTVKKKKVNNEAQYSLEQFF